MQKTDSETILWLYLVAISFLIILNPSLKYVEIKYSRFDLVLCFCARLILASVGFYLLQLWSYYVFHLTYLIWRSDISNRARFLLSRWSKVFIKSQALKIPPISSSKLALKEIAHKKRYPFLSSIILINFISSWLSFFFHLVIRVSINLNCMYCIVACGLMGWGHAWDTFLSFLCTCLYLTVSYLSGWVDILKMSSCNLTLTILWVILYKRPYKLSLWKCRLDLLLLNARWIFSHLQEILKQTGTCV